MAATKHPGNQKPHVVFVPGGVMPSDLSYGPLKSVTGDQIQPIFKELEVYATETPPLDYGLELEVDGIRKVADSAGFKRFHLVGYSAGGASSLAFTARYPERLQSLALIEPAWIGAAVSEEDVKDMEDLERLMSYPPDDLMRAFAQWQMRPGIEPPKLSLPPGPPPAWMARRPAGLRAIGGAFKTYNLDRNRFRQFKQPVYFALGSLSTRYYERSARTLSGFFTDMQIEEYEGRSHFDPPHRAEPERFARALNELWARAGA